MTPEARLSDAIDLAHELLGRISATRTFIINSLTPTFPSAETRILAAETELIALRSGITRLATELEDLLVEHRTAIAWADRQNVDALCLN